MPRLLHGGKNTFFTNSPGTTGYLHAKEQSLDSNLTEYAKINSKWINDELNISAQFIKLLEENTEANLLISYFSTNSERCCCVAEIARKKREKKNNEKCYVSKDTIKKGKDNPCNGRKCLQIMCLVRRLYAQHLNKS